MSEQELAEAGPAAGPASLPRRIVIVGSSGAGKTTLARSLAARLGFPHVEIDAIHWGPNWTPAPLEQFRERTAEALAGECWVADGNYRAVRDLTWGGADSLVWLDFTLPVILRRLTRRTLRRCLTREELWGSNHENLWTQLFTRDSLFLWVLKTYRRHRADYPKQFAQPEYAHLRVVRLHSPRAVEEWLAQVPAAKG